MFGIKRIYFLIALYLNLSISIMTEGNIDIKQFDLDGPPKDLVWSGNSSETVLLLTENDSLYRSDDKGFNWRLLNGILTTTGKDQLDENENEVKKMFLSIIDWKSFQNYSITCRQKSFNIPRNTWNKLDWRR